MSHRDKSSRSWDVHVVLAKISRFYGMFLFAQLLFVLLGFRSVSLGSESVDSAYLERVVRSLNGDIRHADPSAVSYHSAFIYLMENGSKEAIPALIEKLGELPEEIEAGRKKRFRIQCTWSHLKDALTYQTGQEFGYNKERWERWWREEGKSLPSEHYNPAKNRTVVFGKIRARFSSKKQGLIGRLRNLTEIGKIEEELGNALDAVLRNLNTLHLAEVDRKALSTYSIEGWTVWRDDSALRGVAKDARLPRNDLLELKGYAVGVGGFQALFRKSDSKPIALNLDRYKQGSSAR